MRRGRRQETGDRGEAQCSIGFQPVSGRLARHPQTIVIHGTGTTQQASAHVDKKNRLEAYSTMRCGVAAMGARVAPPGIPWDTARRSEAQCSIGFQPVSDRSARHPQTTVIHRTGTTQQASAHVDEKTGWKPILQCVAASLRWVRGWRHREHLGIPLDAPKRNVA
jgi:hypothetical protein